MCGGFRSGDRAPCVLMSWTPGMRLRVFDDRIPLRVGPGNGATGRFVAALAIKPRLVDQLRLALGEEIDEHPPRRQHAAARGEHQPQEQTPEIQSIMRHSY